MPETAIPHVVILGGGFGGLYAARALPRTGVRVTLVDRHNYHLFQPLLYQVATAALNPADIAAPIRSVLADRRNITVLLAEAEAIELGARRVRLADGHIEYDYLIVATGATHSYFGKDGWAAHAPGLKSIEDALEVRRRVLTAYEAAERESDAAQRRAWMTFVIIGAGPTGVEMAGALAEISRHSLAHDFRHIDSRDARIVLIEGQPRVLPGYPETLSQAARAQLERLGVEVWTARRVTAIDADGLSVTPAAPAAPNQGGGSEPLATRTVVWAAGVQASPLARSLGVPLDSAGRVLVQGDLTVPGHPEVCVIGDLAHFEQQGRLVPGVSPAAIQQGRHAASNVVRAIHGEALASFHYLDKGSFATIGRGAAVGDVFGRLQLSGLAAWLAWLFIHIYFLVGFRNRLLVMIQWAYSYLTYRRGARLITGGPPPRLRSPDAG